MTFHPHSLFYHFYQESSSCYFGLLIWKCLCNRDGIQIITDDDDDNYDDYGDFDDDDDDDLRRHLRSIASRLLVPHPNILDPLLLSRHGHLEITSYETG